MLYTIALYLSQLSTNVLMLQYSGSISSDSGIGAIFTLFYTVGEILTMTWPGRVILGMIVGSALARWARS